MRYVYDQQDANWPEGLRCRNLGHTWPRPHRFDRVRGVVVTRDFPKWRALLGLPQVCRRCGTKRYADETRPIPSGGDHD